MAATNKVVIWTTLFVCILLSFDARAGQYSVHKDKFYCPNISNSLRCARSIESELLKQSRLIERPSNNLLVIELNNTKKVQFKDTYVREAAYQSIAYTAIEIMKGDFVLIHKQYYEGNSYMLFSLSTGKSTSLFGYPALSPSNDFMVVAEGSLDSEHGRLVFQLFKVEQNEIIKIFDAEPTNWDAVDVEWISNSLLKFTKRTYNPDYDYMDRNSKRYIEEKFVLSLSDFKKPKIEPEN